jgi:hypothetical protein
MRRLFLVVVALLAGTPAWAQTIDHIDIVEYGIYTADKLKSQRDENGQLHSIIGDVKLEEATTTVPAEPGVKFGIKFRVTGEPDRKPVAIRKVMIYPQPGLRAPNAPEPLLRSEDPISPTIGETVYIGFEFDDPWEQVPGVWTMQLWQGDRMLAEQRFTIVVGRNI